MGLVACPLGGGAPISVQSMTNTDTRDSAATLEQIQALAEAGCEIVRVAVPDEKAAEALFTLVKHSDVPLVADIHFDYRLALMALEAGVHKLRLNPGNIGDEKKVREVVRAAQERVCHPHRGGPSPAICLEKYGWTGNCHGGKRPGTRGPIFERLVFHDIVISVKPLI